MDVLDKERGCIRLIVTINSLWVLDFVNMEFQRHPRQEDSRMTTWVAYEQTEWTPFESFQQNEPYEDEDMLAGRIRFTVAGPMLPGGWITSTFDPKEQ